MRIRMEQETVRSKSVKPRPSFWRAETIAQKLTLGFLIILVLLSISGVVAYVELSTVGSDARRMEVASMQAMDASHLQRLAQTAILPVQDYVLTGDAGARGQFEKTSSDLNAIMAELGLKTAVALTTNLAVQPAPTQAMPTQDMSSQSMGSQDMTSQTMSTQSTPAQAMSTEVMPSQNMGSQGTSSQGMSDMSTQGMGAGSLALSVDQLTLLSNFDNLWARVHDQAEMIFAISNPVGNQDAINQLRGLEASSQSMAAYAESIHVVQMESVSNTQNEVNATILRTSLFLIIVILSAFGLGAFLSRLISRAISQPVSQLTQISNNISLGDLDTKVDVRGGGEVGELAGAIERMRTSLKMIIERLSDEEEDLRTWTTQLASHELRRKVRGGIITLGGHKYLVGKELDGQYVYVRLDYDLREIVITPPSGDIKHLAISA